MMEFKTYDVIVVGSGAAGLNGAIRLAESGKKTAIITEGIALSTSRNTGSDKQTYYKLGLSGESPDSVRKMAENLFAGGATDGDNALCEAALSARGFLNLCELGVPFPVNRYGEYVGYKTDHDPYERATSAGPLTSKFMTEALERKLKTLDVDLYSGFEGIEILKNGNRICGLIALEIKTGELSSFRCSDILLATGGPGGIYADSVYPSCHNGSTSLGLRAGATGQNLTEWQFGIASVSPRWNVSGTYMQVLPRFVSVDSEGVEREFLSEYFEDEYEALSAVFLKGYQWPFHCEKLSGSSVIDLLVYREKNERGRRVYLDFKKNPFGLPEIEFEKLSAEAYEYLKGAEACFGTPIERLRKMNMPAVELYKGKGRDIEEEYLEIALCAQHHNGGYGVDMWWQTAVSGLFAAGECAGTHGVTRPGGSALNAGQTGSLRAAQFISAKESAFMPEAEFKKLSENTLAAIEAELEIAEGNEDFLEKHIRDARERMSLCGGAVRRIPKMQEILSKTLSELPVMHGIRSRERRHLYFRLKDILFTQAAVLSQMLYYCECGAGSRGSAVYSSGNADDIMKGGFEKENESRRKRIIETRYENGKFKSFEREVRPMPGDAGVFENVWRSYRENKNIY